MRLPGPSIALRVVRMERGRGLMNFLGNHTTQESPVMPEFTDAIALLKADHRTVEDPDKE